MPIDSMQDDFCSRKLWNIVGENCTSSSDLEPKFEQFHFVPDESLVCVCSACQGDVFAKTKVAHVNRLARVTGHIFKKQSSCTSHLHAQEYSRAS